jgi:GST-like protein
MLELYAADTPNGHRAAVVLEGMSLAYDLKVVDVFKGEAATAEMLALNGRGRVPVLVDNDAVDGRNIVTQSWVIALYLAEKTGLFIPSDKAGRRVVSEWLFHVASDVMMVHSTLNAVTNFVPEKVPSTIDFYEKRLLGLLKNLDMHLSAGDYLAGELTIADFGLYPIYNFRRDFIAAHAGELAHLARWGERMDARPGCVRGVSAIRERT